MGRNDQDLETSTSFIPSPSPGEDSIHYEAVKSSADIEGGALVEGGAISLLSREAMALFAQYAAIGVVLSMLPALQYPIFNNYLKLEGYQTASYGQLVTLGWSFKVFFGMLSDCCPIFGYRRKSWMLIGWTVTMVCLAIMTFTSLGDPYCNAEKAITEGRPDACSIIYYKTADEDKKYFNLDAPDSGTMFILLSTLVSFSYITADCAADAMTTIYVVRNLFGILSNLTTGFGLSSPNFGGEFSFSLSPNVPYGICLVPCVAVVLATIFLMEEKKSRGMPFRDYINMFWNLLQQRVMWQICAFRFISNVFQAIGSTAGGPMYSLWAKVTPLNDALSTILGGVIFSAILAVVAKWGLHWNWRYTIISGTLGVIVIDAPIVFITIWNVFRNQWFYNGVGLAENVPEGVRFMVASFCAVEIADVGNEGATYGLITTVANLTGPFVAIIYKLIDSNFKLSQDDITEDTTEVRWDVTYSYLISYCSKIFSLVWLFMLPHQRVPLQELKRNGGKSKFAGTLLVVLFIACVAFSVTSNIHSIFPSTKCYRIAGGDGKLDPVTHKCPLPAPPRDRYSFYLLKNVFVGY
ncbi:hypothetical protein LEN26_016457 [Aphanomyces euteiches]|nr:hypothetical protein LEN26_016457 [Aphanomyces euteiches]